VKLRRPELSAEINSQVLPVPDWVLVNG